MRMSSDEYAAFVDSLSPRSPIWGDLLRAGLVGGVICTLGQALTDLYTACGAAAETASVLNSSAGDTTAFANPVIGTSDPAPAKRARSS